MSQGTKPPPLTLVNHRTVAGWWDVDSKTLSRWVRTGHFPLPHSEQGRFLMFDRAVIEHRLKTGLWPEGTKFRGSGA